MAVGVSLLSARSVQWPSPRLKAGGLSVLHSGEYVSRKLPYVSQTNEFDGAREPMQKCYLSARNTRQTRSPSPPRARSARLGQMAASMPQPDKVSPLNNFRSTSPPNLSPCREHPSTSSTSPPETGPPIPFSGQDPSASAPESSRRRGSDEVRRSGRRSDGCYQSEKVSHSPYEVTHEAAHHYSRGICDPEHICDTAARIPHAVHLCRKSIQMDQEHLAEVAAAYASRRREQHAQECMQSRQKAALWRLRCAERKKADEKRLRLQRMAEEEANKRQADETHKETKEKLREKKMSRFRQLLDSADEFQRKRKINEEPISVADTQESQVKKGNSQSKTRVDGAKAQKAERTEPSPSPGVENKVVKRSASLEALRKKRFINTSTHDDLSRCLAGRMSAAIFGGVATFKARKSLDAANAKIIAAAFEMPPAMATPDQRIEAARQAKKLKARSERKAEEEQDRKMRYELLPYEEKSLIEHVYELNERHGLGLDTEGLRDSLRELGIKGNCTEEWSLLLKMCKEYLPKRWDMLVEMGEAQKRIGCCLQRFAVDAVPAVKKALIEHRRCKLQTYCAKEAKRDWEDGTLDVDDLAEKIHELWPLEVDAGDQTRVVEKMKRIIRMHIVDEGEMLELSAEIETLSASLQKEASARQRSLLQEHHIDIRTFSLFRQDLLTMWQLFDKLAVEGCENENDEEETHLNPELNKRDMLYLCTELGIIPKQVPVLTNLADAGRDRIERGCPCNFDMFLNIIMEIEEVMEPITEWSCRHLDRIFEQFQVDDEFEVAPYVILADIPHIFEKAGLPINDPLVRPAVRRVLSDADMEGRGRIMISTVKSLYNLTKKRIKQLQLLGEFAVAEEYNFTTREFREMHAVFGTLDTDGSGSLEIQEVRQAVVLLKLDLKLESHFAVAFEMLDADDSGALDFQEFMNFIKMVRDREGAFKEADKTVVSTLKDLDRMDLVRLLDCMKKAGDDLDKADTEALMKETCARLEISSSTVLASAFNVKTLEDLYTYARSVVMHRH